MSSYIQNLLPEPCVLMFTPCLMGGQEVGVWMRDDRWCADRNCAYTTVTVLSLIDMVSRLPPLLRECEKLGGWYCRTSGCAKASSEILFNNNCWLPSSDTCWQEVKVYDVPWQNYSVNIELMHHRALFLLDILQDIFAYFLSRLWSPQSVTAVLTCN